MARKTLDFVVHDEGRDHGKTFRITEWDAFKADNWGFRVMSAAQRAGVDVDPGVAQYGMQAVAALGGIEGLFRAQTAESQPLWDELLECCTFVPDPVTTPMFTIRLRESVEEMATLTTLRLQALRLHINFSQAGESQNSQRTSPSTTSAPAATSPITPISPQPSAPSFRGKPPRSAISKRR